MVSPKKIYWLYIKWLKHKQKSHLECQDSNQRKINMVRIQLVNSIAHLLWLPLINALKDAEKMLKVDEMLLQLHLL